ncbi:NADPH-dependent FMN reductase [Polycladidibacter stylochi]|uniref:NADPH-dependent FMN reductase n=1 Tax=Polycladidibacter stylochi TaxID=1807766 RepID=UPI0008379302|nr:NAD(P)H-dependent oxidoreductase [Pseudovibrio stylochi]
MPPRIMVISGSKRSGSQNMKLAALASSYFSRLGADVSLINLSDFPMPIYDGDLEMEKGVPEHALKLRAFMLQQQGVFITSPEYNASISPLLKNTLDWMSREKSDGRSPFQNRVFALGAASPGGLGGIRGLMHLRNLMEVGLGATVIPEMIALGNAGSAYDEDGNLQDDALKTRLQALAKRLVREAGFIEL